MLLITSILRNSMWWVRSQKLKSQSNILLTERWYRRCQQIWKIWVEYSVTTSPSKVLYILLLNDWIPSLVVFEIVIFMFVCIFFSKKMKKMQSVLFSLLFLCMISLSRLGEGYFFVPKVWRAAFWSSWLCLIPWKSEGIGRVLVSVLYIFMTDFLPFSTLPTPRCIWVPETIFFVFHSFVNRNLDVSSSG